MDPRTLVDDAMELLVAPSFTRLGIAARRRLHGWEDLAALRMDGRTVAVTGATSGIGLAASRQLAGMGARLLLLVRDVERGETERATLQGENHAVVRCEMGDPSSVRAAAARVRQLAPSLDVLIHNAGALLPEYRESVGGHEVTFAVMVLGPQLLTRELLPLLSEGSRILWMSSGGMYTQRLDVDQLEMGPDGYRGSLAYARAKRAQVALAQAWARRLRDRGIVVHAMHPGWVDTPGIREGLPAFRALMDPFLRDPDQGADTLVWLAAADEPGRSTGRFWLDRRPRTIERIPGSAGDVRERDRLWDLVERLTTGG
jgi:dehydrogenase/reductase SDR family protein 12